MLLPFGERQAPALRLAAPIADLLLGRNRSHASRTLEPIPIRNPRAVEWAGNGRRPLEENLSL